MKKLILLLLFIAIPIIGIAQTADSINAEIQRLEKEKQTLVDKQNQAVEKAKGKTAEDIQAKEIAIKGLNSKLSWTYQPSGYLGSDLAITILPNGSLNFKIVNYQRETLYFDCGSVLGSSNTVYQVPSTQTEINIPPDKLVELFQWLKERGIDPVKAEKAKDKCPKCGISLIETGESFSYDTYPPMIVQTKKCPKCGWRNTP